ncbi:MAG: nuclear transport factor 2 family protein [Saprospiraceae bacterium]
MSNNLSTIEQMFACFGQGDIPGILAKLADDVVFQNTSNTPVGGTYHGKAGAMEYFQKLGGTSETTAIAPSNFRESGNQLQHDVHQEGIVRATGKAFSIDMLFAWTFNDAGEVTSWKSTGDFTNLEAAFSN